MSVINQFGAGSAVNARSTGGANNSSIFNPVTPIAKPQGTGAPTNPLAIFRGGSRILGQGAMDTFNTFNQNIPAYNANVANELQNWTNPEGRAMIANENRDTAIAQGQDAGRAASSEIAKQGLGIGTQDAAKAGQVQAALQHANAFQDHLNTPTGRGEILQYVTSLANQLGPSNPMYQEIVSLAQAIQGSKDPQQPSNGILGSLAPIAGQILGGAAAAGKLGGI